MRAPLLADADASAGAGDEGRLLCAPLGKGGAGGATLVLVLALSFLAQVACLKVLADVLADRTAAFATAIAIATALAGLLAWAVGEPGESRRPSWMAPHAGLCCGCCGRCETPVSKRLRDIPRNPIPAWLICQVGIPDAIVRYLSAVALAFVPGPAVPAILDGALSARLATVALARGHCPSRGHLGAMALSLAALAAAVVPAASALSLSLAASTVDHPVCGGRLLSAGVAVGVATVGAVLSGMVAGIRELVLARGMRLPRNQRHHAVPVASSVPKLPPPPLQALPPPSSGQVRASLALGGLCVAVLAVPFAGIVQRPDHPQPLTTAVGHIVDGLGCALAAGAGVAAPSCPLSAPLAGANATTDPSAHPLYFSAAAPAPSPCLPCTNAPVLLAGFAVASIVVGLVTHALLELAAVTRRRWVTSRIHHEGRLAPSVPDASSPLARQPARGDNLPLAPPALVRIASVPTRGAAAANRTLTRVADEHEHRKRASCAVACVPGTYCRMCNVRCGPMVWVGQQLALAWGVGLAGLWVVLAVRAGLLYGWGEDLPGGGMASPLLLYPWAAPPALAHAASAAGLCGGVVEAPLSPWYWVSILCAVWARLESGAADDREATAVAYVRAGVRPPDATAVERASHEWTRSHGYHDA